MHESMAVPPLKSQMILSIHLKAGIMGIKPHLGHTKPVKKVHFPFAISTATTAGLLSPHGGLIILRNEKLEANICKALRDCYWCKA